MTDELKQAIIDNASGPSEVRGDSGSIRQHSLVDQIAADKHIAATEAVSDKTKKTFGVRFGTLVPPGAV